MKPFDLCRAPKGTTVIYDFDSPSERTTWNGRLSAAGSKVGAKLERIAINGFDTAARPHYLLKATVMVPGAPKKNHKEK